MLLAETHECRRTPHTDFARNKGTVVFDEVLCCRLCGYYVAFFSDGSDAAPALNRMRTNDLATAVVRTSARVRTISLLELTVQM